MGVEDRFLGAMISFLNFEEVPHILHLVQMLTIPLAGGMLNFTTRTLALNVSPYKGN